MNDPHHQVALIEAEIEHLYEKADRCRKVIIIGKVGALVGALLLAALLAGLFRSNAALLVSSITAALGGIALSGSSQGTFEALRERIREREALRSQIIDGLELQTRRGA